MPEERRSHLQTTKYGPTEKDTRDENMWRNVVFGEVETTAHLTVFGWMNE